MIQRTKKKNSIDIGPELVTIERTKLLEILDGLDIYGGGDCPEKTLSGISLALKYALPRSFVYIFTDATAIDYELEDTVIEQIQQKQATVRITIDLNLMKKLNCLFLYFILAKFSGNI